jgi:hypothetical protein
MIRIAVTQYPEVSCLHGFSSPGKLEASEHLSPSDLHKFWEMIRDGHFENHVRAELETLCNQRGWNAGEILR